MRTFIAVPMPVTPSLQRVMCQLDEMRPPLKVISADQLHITTVFLGETDESLVPTIGAIIQEVAASVTLPELKLRGLGAFSNASQPNIIWAGVADPRPLVQLYDHLIRRCQPLGFARETRPFHPHLTLARVKLQMPRSLTTFVHEHATTDFGPVRPVDLILFRSGLGPNGPTYTRLKTATVASRT